jgi:hypothetical protein
MICPFKFKKVWKINETMSICNARENICAATQREGARTGAPGNQKGSRELAIAAGQFGAV